MSTHHGLNYVELPAPDLAAAKDFYGTAFGWTFTDYGDAYAGFNSGAAAAGAEDGGFNPELAPRDGGTLVLLYSEDLDASVAAVASAGGSVTAGPYAFPGGRRFHFSDPAGNELGVWSST